MNRSGFQVSPAPFYSIVFLTGKAKSNYFLFQMRKLGLREGTGSRAHGELAEAWRQNLRATCPLENGPTLSSGPPS